MDSHALPASHEHPATSYKNLYITYLHWHSISATDTVITNRSKVHLGFDLMPYSLTVKASLLHSTYIMITCIPTFYKQSIFHVQTV